MESATKLAAAIAAVCLLAVALTYPKSAAERRQAQSLQIILASGHLTLGDAHPR
jgi:hypothetical protein